MSYLEHCTENLFSFFTISVPIGDLHKVSNYKNYKNIFLEMFITMQKFSTVCILRLWGEGGGIKPRAESCMTVGFLVLGVPSLVLFGFYFYSDFFYLMKVLQSTKFVHMVPSGMPRSTAKGRLQMHCLTFRYTTDSDIALFINE